MMVLFPFLSNKFFHRIKITPRFPKHFEFFISLFKRPFKMKKQRMVDIDFNYSKKLKNNNNNLLIQPTASTVPQGDIEVF